MDKLSNKTEKYFEDESRLQAIFPEEIWLLILNRNNGADYFQNCCTASTYFQKLLYPHRARHLFSSVITYLTNFIFLTPEAYPELLKCRLVCRAWKLGVDNELKSILNQCVPNACDWINSSDPPSTINTNKAALLYSFSNENHVDRFLAFFHDSHFLTGTNPFPSRAIRISICPNLETKLAYYQKLVQLLQIYGHHVWHCFILIQCEIWDKSEVKLFMDIFHPILESLTQLRSLRIRHDSNIDQSHALEKALRTKTLPRFEKLEFLEEKGLARAILSSLIQSNTQITKLISHNADCNVPSTQWSDSRMIATPLLKLEELHILCYRSAETFTNLQNLQVAWPLKKLTLYSHPDISNVENVFTFLETRFAETLTDLDISLLQDKLSVSNLRDLALPNVKNLKIQTNFYTSMDFLLPMANSLTCLSVTICGMARWKNKFEKNSTVKFFMHCDNLLKSNVWGHFRKLRELTYVSWNLPMQEHRRDQWERYNFNRYSQTSTEI